jgi:hypothetical protein
MTDPAAWDGYPQERERDGWHWLEYEEDIRSPWDKPVPARWTAETQDWDFVGHYEETPRAKAAGIYRYLGPCALPGEDKAAWLKGWEAAREGAEAAAESERALWAQMRDSDAEFVACKVQDAIRAMEPPKQGPQG